MKTIIQFFIAVIVVTISLLFLVNWMNKEQGYSGNNTLTIYNWGEYIDPDLITQFEEETGITIIYETFDSNEAMMTKIAQGGTSFDVTVPSDYAIDKMKQDNLLIPLDLSKISNMKYIDKRFLNKSFDEGNKYSVPYFWGTLGIVYNEKLLKGREFTSWADLWDKKLKNQILMVDSSREIIGVGLAKLGYSLNDTNKAHIEEARKELAKLAPNVKAIVGDEMNLLLTNEEAPIGVMWSGNAADMMADNEDLNYMVPKEGSNIWFDNMVIPKGAKNIEGAYKFINFMLDPEHAAQNTEYVGYSTPNKKALTLLPKEISEDERFYPNEETVNHLEVYENLGKKLLAFYSEQFLKFEIELDQ